MSLQPPDEVNAQPAKTRRQKRHEKRQDFFDDNIWVFFLIVVLTALLGSSVILATRHFFGLGAMLAVVVPMCVFFLLHNPNRGPSAPQDSTSAPGASDRCPLCGRSYDPADELCTAGGAHPPSGLETPQP
ncbi:MAG: hypothetical protein KTV68_03045 [Acidimicrobiia bacterium]|nr:hypothetical protein [Acidimicrobiia bacterium]MCY4435647.1 hypothetical protein [bacterium]